MKKGITKIVFDMKGFAHVLGAILMVLAFIFIGGRLINMWHEIDLSVLVSHWAIIGLIAIVLIETFNMYASAFNYRSIIGNISGIYVKKTLALLVYTSSNLYKYIPGGVMFFIGRNQIVFKNKKLTHGEVALSTLLESVLWVVVGITIAALYALYYPLNYLREHGITPLVSIAALIVVLMAIIIAYYFRKGILEIYHNIKKKNKDFRLSVILKRFGSTFIIINIWALSFLLTVIVMGQDVTLASAITIMGLYTLAWLAGFLVPVSPGGIGIREAVLLVFLTGIVNEGVLISAMLMHRILQIAGDVLAYLWVATYNRFLKDKLILEKSNQS